MPDGRSSSRTGTGGDAPLTRAYTSAAPTSFVVLGASCPLPFVTSELVRDKGSMQGELRDGKWRRRRDAEGDPPEVQPVPVDSMVR